MLADITLIVEENIKWNFGSVVEWLSAIGTLAALAFSFYLFKESKKRKGKIVLEGYIPKEDLYLAKNPNVRIHFFNSGSVPIKIVRYGVGFKSLNTKFNFKKNCLNLFKNKNQNIIKSLELIEWRENYSLNQDGILPYIIQPQDDCYLYWDRASLEKKAVGKKNIVVFILDSGGNAYLSVNKVI